jgi:polysaccharide biosynthesis PFTS motif protein
MKFRKFIRIRKIVRGYNILKKQKNLGKISDTKNLLLNTSLKTESSVDEKFFFGAANEKVEELCRDFLISTVGHYELNKKLLASLGDKEKKIVTPMPKTWQKSLITSGFNVAQGESDAYWKIFLVFCWLIGVAFAFKIFCFGLLKKNKQNKKITTVYFGGLSENEISKEHGLKNNNIISWYLKKFSKSKTEKKIFHNQPKIKPISLKCVRFEYGNPLQPIHDIRKNINFLFWASKASLLALIKFFFGEWWYPLLLREAIMAQLHKQNKFFADLYLFPSHVKRRRAWTYEAAAKGSQVKLYFYSTNSDFITKVKKPWEAPHHFRKIEWPEILVWDKTQAKFLERAEVKAKITVVGPIWFSGTEKIQANNFKRSIALFDVAPRRISTYAWLGLNDEYLQAKTMIQFFEDIIEAAQKYDWTLFWKGKRHFKKTELQSVSKKYLKKLKFYEASQKIKVISPRVSAFELVQKTTLTISIPFTSPSIIAHHTGKKSFFYNPHKDIKLNKSAAHGVSILNGRKALLQTLKSDQFT